MRGVRADLPMVEIVDRYDMGESISTLAQAYGVGTTTVWRRLRALGMDPAGRPHCHKRGGPRWVGSGGYLNTTNRKGWPCRIHRACWEACHGPISRKLIVHHLDGDRLNNNIENLACMGQGDHVRLHKAERRASGGGG